MRLSWDYIEWAHGPGAESGQPLAQRLCALPAVKLGQVDVPVDLLPEVISVAELYVGGADTDLRAARVLKRARAALAVTKTK